MQHVEAPASLANWLPCLADSDCHTGVSVSSALRPAAVSMGDTLRSSSTTLRTYFFTQSAISKGISATSTITRKGGRDGLVIDPFDQLHRRNIERLAKFGDELGVEASDAPLIGYEAVRGGERNSRSLRETVPGRAVELLQEMGDSNAVHGHKMGTYAAIGDIVNFGYIHLVLYPTVVIFFVSTTKGSFLMPCTPQIQIKEIREEAPHWSDFTPAPARSYARALELTQGPVKLHLSEVERDDPTSVYLSMSVPATKRAKNDARASIEGYVDNDVLDTMIELLTIARDKAIVEGMIEPHLS